MSCTFLAGAQLHALVVDHDQRAVALHHRPRLGEIERHDGDVFHQDVLPDVELGPVRQRKDADGFAGPHARVVEPPEFGPLVLRIPGMRRRAEREDALLGAGLFFVAPRAAEGRVEAVFVERLLQAFRLHHLGMKRRAGIERIDAAPDAVLVDMHEQVEAEPLGGRVAELDHFTKLPCRIDMEERERRLRRIERLHRQMKHHRRVLADRIKHDRVAEFGRNLAHDVDALGLQALQVRRRRGAVEFCHACQRMPAIRKIA